MQVKSEFTNWTDVVAPTKDNFEELAQKYNIAKKVFLNCLDPDYLPHVENYGSTQFVIYVFQSQIQKLMLTQFKS